MFASLRKSRPEIPLGLALGGGGARGLAHIGVLKVLEANGIRPNMIVGTSMGAIIGGLYAHLQDAKLLETLVRSRLQSPVLKKLGLGSFEKGPVKRDAARRSLSKTQEQLTRIFLLASVLTKDHIIAEKKVKELLAHMLPDQQIDDLPIRFGAVATDLAAGTSRLFDHGHLPTAVRASAAIPGIFPPVVQNGRQLVDGCVVSLVPVMETRSLGASWVIAVDVTQPLIENKIFQTGVEIWLRADKITSMALNQYHLQQADALIRVENLYQEWSAFQAIDELVRAGEKAAADALPSIHKALARVSTQARGQRPWWRRWFAPGAGRSGDKTPPRTA